MLEPEEIVLKERLDECTRILAEELARASTSYAHYVAGGNMGIPKVVFLQQQVFQLQREIKMYKMSLSENQLKNCPCFDNTGADSFLHGPDRALLNSIISNGNL